jgi:hypothetical protein
VAATTDGKSSTRGTSAVLEAILNKKRRDGSVIIHQLMYGLLAYWRSLSFEKMHDPSEGQEPCHLPVRAGASSHGTVPIYSSYCRYGVSGVIGVFCRAAVIYFCPWGRTPALSRKRLDAACRERQEGFPANYLSSVNETTQ